MGLDSYLERELYIPARTDAVVKINDMIIANAHTVVQKAGYWRKNWTIHNWFVQNVQEGVDDCGKYAVEREHLEKLLEFCKTAEMEEDERKYSIEIIKMILRLKTVDAEMNSKNGIWVSYRYTGSW
jgi:hypothetical protein